MFHKPTALEIAKRNPVNPESKRTAIITGASSGIGLATAYALSKTGWRVICAVRSVPKMEKEIKRLGEVGPGSMEIMELDLNSFQSVKNFAAAFLSRTDVPTLDVLMLNAGLATSWELTKDGYENTFQICHLSHHLLTRLLEEKLIQSAPSRVIIVSSEAHRAAGEYDWPRENHKGFRADGRVSILRLYSQNKLANIHFGLTLGNRLHDKRISVIALHPGAVNSSIWPSWVIGRSLYMLSNEQGAATQTYLATDPKFGPEYKVGGYWKPGSWGGIVEAKPTARGRNEKTAQRLWDETEKIIASYL